MATLATFSFDIFREKYAGNPRKIKISFGFGVWRSRGREQKLEKGKKWLVFRLGPRCLIVKINNQVSPDAHVPVRGKRRRVYRVRTNRKTDGGNK